MKREETMYSLTMKAMAAIGFVPLMAVQAVAQDYGSFDDYTLRV